MRIGKHFDLIRVRSDNDLITIKRVSDGQTARKPLQTFFCKFPNPFSRRTQKVKSIFSPFFRLIQTIEEKKNMENTSTSKWQHLLQLHMKPQTDVVTIKWTKCHRCYFHRSFSLFLFLCLVKHDDNNNHNHNAQHLLPSSKRTYKKYKWFVPSFHSTSTLRRWTHCDIAYFFPFGVARQFSYHLTSANIKESNANKQIERCVSRGSQIAAHIQRHHCQQLNSDDSK